MMAKTEHDIKKEVVKDVLRRMVLMSKDGYHASIRDFLIAADFPIPQNGWAKVTGNNLVVYCSGQEPDRPDVVDKLVGILGGNWSVGSTPTDRGWYEWRWEATV